MTSQFTDLDPLMAEIDAMNDLTWDIRFGSAGYNVKQSYLVKGLLPDHSLACIYGPSGSFKSFLALSWCCHVATGTDWDDRSVKAGSVLYIAGEGGVGVSRRIRAWEKKYDKSTSSHLARIDCPVFPADPLQVSQLIKVCSRIEAESEKPVSLIVFDTVARCFGGSDENSAKDMGAFIKGCDLIKQKTGATVLVVHHTGKNIENGARGSSSLRAALDVEILVQRESNFSVVVECTKMKDGEQPSGLAFELQSVHLLTDAENDPVTSLALIDQSREPKEARTQSKPISGNHQALWQAVRSRLQRGDSTAYEVVRDDLKSHGLNTNHYSRWVKDLIAKKMLVRKGDDLVVIEAESAA